MGPLAQAHGPIGFFLGAQPNQPACCPFRVGPWPWAHGPAPIWAKARAARQDVLYNCPLKGIGVRDAIIILGDFSLFVFRFSIGCGSKFRAEVAYLEVGSSDFEQIHGKNYFHEISDIFMDKI